MKPSAGLDLRAFRWPLAPLERKHAHALDTAWMGLAGIRREVGVAQAELLALREAHAADVRALSESCAGGIDARVRLSALQYLADAQQQMQRRTAQANALGARADGAAKDCIEADRRLASVRKLRQAALATFAAQQLRRGFREADLGWVMRAAAAGRVKAPGEGEA
jgi:flagellar biosynthesis chaperone FliJ